MPLAEASHHTQEFLLASRCGRDHLRTEIDEGDDVTWIAATDEWLLASQAQVHGITRPLSPINMITLLNEIFVGKPLEESQTSKAWREI